MIFQTQGSVLEGKFKDISLPDVVRDVVQWWFRASNHHQRHQHTHLFTSHHLITRINVMLMFVMMIMIQWWRWWWKWKRHKFGILKLLLKLIPSSNAKGGFFSLLLMTITMRLMTFLILNILSRITVAGDSDIVVSNPTRWSLLFIFGFLYGSFHHLSSSEI